MRYRSLCVAYRRTLSRRSRVLRALLICFAVCCVRGMRLRNMNVMFATIRTAVFLRIRELGGGLIALGGTHIRVDVVDFSAGEQGHVR